MNKIIITLFLLIVISSSAFSQNQDEKVTSSNVSTVGTTMFDIKHNAVYNEDILAFCYERLFPVKDKFGIALKGGVVIFDPFLLIAEVATVFGAPKHFFETGVGAIPDVIYGGGFLTLRAGYRYQAPKGFLFKASAIYSPDNFIIPVITLGYAF